jgi:ferredoxin
MAVVTFEPDGAMIDVPEGTPVLAAVLRAGRPIGYACRGRGVCVACRVDVRGPTSAVEPDEAALLDRLSPEQRGPDTRIACLARVLGDVHVRATYW